MDLLEIVRMIAALAITLGLVGLAAWGLRRFGPSALLRMQTPAAERRLAIVETLILDPSRRLVLVRIDAEEKLILLGEGSILPAPKAGATP